MKKYIYSVLGALTGIWLSVIIGFVLLLMVITVAVSESKVELKDDSILKIKLSGTACDRELPENPLNEFYGMAEHQIPINNVVAAIKKAKTDDRISGIYIECDGAIMGLAQAQAIKDAISDFKESGKWVVAYSDNYSQTEYFLATAADSVFLNSIGLVDIHGLRITTFYFKDFMDKIGVEAQVVKVGTYKSAVEPFVLNSMSDANKEQQEHFIGEMWQTIASEIAERRNVGVDTVKVWANNFSFTQTPDSYLSNNMIDGLKYHHEIDDMLAEKTGHEKPIFVDYSDYLTAVSDMSKSGPNDVKIAVLYAVGDITESADDGIASDKYVPEILRLAERDDIDGLVLRVNSGGGSAFASEQIWEALEQFKKSGKPYYVSMSDMAASGGYYISCGADKIYAEPLTLTGSIGIFGIIPNIDPLLSKKIGINTYTVATGDGGMPNGVAGILKPMSPQMKAAMQTYVDRGYHLFVSRCAEGRKMEYADVAAVAEGRVWDGGSALKHGLVDVLGGLEDALNDMVSSLDADNYIIEEFPKVDLTIWNMLKTIGRSSVDVNSLIKSELGQGYRYYKMIDQIGEIHPLQCRMDFISIE